MIPKFRAWHKPTQLMDDAVLIDFYNEKIGILYADPFVQGESIQKYNFNEIELMQSTGLHDKNGVKIYEGDIVKQHNDILGEVFYNTSHCAYLLQDINGNRNRCQFDKLGNYSSLCIEVIGNIYENPEMLNVEQTGGTERKEREMEK